MRTLDLAERFYARYGEIEEINNYYGLLANYALVQVSWEAGEETGLARCQGLLRQYPDGVNHPYYNFPCYQLGGNAAAWADLVGLQRRSPGELEWFAEATVAGPKDEAGLLCLPGGQKEGKIWIDTLTAVTPFLLFAGLARNREDWIDFAAKQCFGMIDALLDRDCGLLHQSRGFLGKGICSQDHWGRGNGWGYLALAELVQYLPEASAHRGKALRYYRELSRVLLDCQGERGLWNQELTTSDGWEESSGTALILYSMGIGLRHGILDRAIYWDAFEKGLFGLLRYGAERDFSTRLCCPGCLCPGDGSIRAYLTEKQPQRNEHHSFGCYMLALVEAHRNEITEIDWAELHPEIGGFET